MAKFLFILGCSNKKADTARCAGDLYLSDRFLAAKKIAKKFSSDWLILSAKYGILDNKRTIDPYDVSIKDLNRESYDRWVSECAAQILARTSLSDHVIYLGDSDYFADIKDKLFLRGRRVFTPLEYVPSVDQAKWLSTFSTQRKKLDDFYALFDYYVEKFSLLINFSEFTKKNCVFDQGLYIFLHADEKRLLDPTHLKIARIGSNQNPHSGSVSKRIKAQMMVSGTIEAQYLGAMSGVL